jgi:hypothetical protein
MVSHPNIVGAEALSFPGYFLNEGDAVIAEAAPPPFVPSARLQPTSCSIDFSPDIPARCHPRSTRM